MNIRWGTGDLDIANLSLVLKNVVVVHVGEGTVKVGATAPREVLDPVDNVGVTQVQCVAGCGDPSRGLVVINATTRISWRPIKIRSPDLVPLEICRQKRPGCGPRVKLQNPGVVWTRTTVGRHCSLSNDHCALGAKTQIRDRASPRGLVTVLCHLVRRQSNFQAGRAHDTTLRI